MILDPAAIIMPFVQLGKEIVTAEWVLVNAILNIVLHQMWTQWVVWDSPIIPRLIAW